MARNNMHCNRLSGFWLLIVSLLLVFFVPAFAEDSPAPKTLTFTDFYQKVLSYYPRLKQQNANVNLALARKLQAISGFLPRLQGGVSAMRGDDPVFVFGSLLHEGEFSSANFELPSLNSPRPHTTYGASLEGNLPIFDAFQTISRVRSAKLKVDSARYEESFTRMEAFLVASEAYLRAVAIENMLSAVNQVVDDSEGDIKQAENLKDKGLILGADFYAAKVMHGNNLQLKNQLTQERQASHMLMNILMWEDPFKTFEVEGELGAAAKAPKNLQAWLEEAYRLRPDLFALDKEIQAQGIEVSREKSTLLPRLDAFGEAREDTHNFSSDGGQNYIIGLKAKMDLYDPAYASRVRIQKETLKSLEADKIILKDAIAKDLANEYAHYQAAGDNLPVNSRMLEDARQAVELTIPLYREGRKSIADLLQIRSAYLAAARGYYTLDTDLRASWTRLLYLSGALDESQMKTTVKP